MKERKYGAIRASGSIWNWNKARALPTVLFALACLVILSYCPSIFCPFAFAEDDFYKVTPPGSSSKLTMYILKYGTGVKGASILDPVGAAKSFGDAASLKYDVLRARISPDNIEAIDKAIAKYEELEKSGKLEKTKEWSQFEDTAKLVGGARIIIDPEAWPHYKPGQNTIVLGLDKNKRNPFDGGSLRSTLAHEAGHMRKDYYEVWNDQYYLGPDGKHYVNERLNAGTAFEEGYAVHKQMLATSSSNYRFWWFDIKTEDKTKSGKYSTTLRSFATYGELIEAEVVNAQILCDIATKVPDGEKKIDALMNEKRSNGINTIEGFLTAFVQKYPESAATVGKAFDEQTHYQASSERVKKIFGEEYANKRSPGLVRSALNGLKDFFGGSKNGEDYKRLADSETPAAPAFSGTRISDMSEPSASGKSASASNSSVSSGGSVSSNGSDSSNNGDSSDSAGSSNPTVSQAALGAAKASLDAAYREFTLAVESGDENRIEEAKKRYLEAKDSWQRTQNSR
jgi:hypothetical protein